MDMYEHFAQCYPREACGVIVENDVFIPCTNIAEAKDDFIMSHREFIKLSRKHKIKAIVHTHPDVPPIPSDSDIKSCNAIQIPYIIYSFPSMERYELQPSKIDLPLLGRQYEFGKYDCLEAVRDYYKFYNLAELRERSNYEDNWWVKGLDYFTQDHLQDWGFYKVEDLRPNDVLIFSVNSNIPNHCGVYVGNDQFYHHAFNRLSCEENLYPMWKKFLIGIYRYEKNSLF